MPNCNGYIRLHRKLLEWGWYKSLPTKVVFIHCLLKANWTDGEYMGVRIPAGSFATSLYHLADETGCTVSQVRTAIKHLILTHEIAYESHKDFSVISMLSWDSYQHDGTQFDNQVAFKSQADSTNIKKEKAKKLYSKDFIDSWIEGGN